MLVRTVPPPWCCGCCVGEQGRAACACACACMPEGAVGWQGCSLFVVWQTVCRPRESSPRLLCSHPLCPLLPDKPRHAPAQRDLCMHCCLGEQHPPGSGPTGHAGLLEWEHPARGCGQVVVHPAPGGHRDSGRGGLVLLDPNASQQQPWGPFCCDRSRSMCRLL